MFCVKATPNSSIGMSQFSELKEQNCVYVDSLDLNSTFVILVDSLCDKNRENHFTSVAVLIDEYDYPILHTLHDITLAKAVTSSRPPELPEHICALIRMPKGTKGTFEITNPSYEGLIGKEKYYLGPTFKVTREDGLCKYVNGPDTKIS